jgi:TATA-box binding protein (TBP) (component of TFIID and TFIIIB)
MNQKLNSDLVESWLSQIELIVHSAEHNEEFDVSLVGIGRKLFDIHYSIQELTTLMYACEDDRVFVFPTFNGIKNITTRVSIKDIAKEISSLGNEIEDKVIKLTNPVEIGFNLSQLMTYLLEYWSWLGDIMHILYLEEHPEEEDEST